MIVCLLGDLAPEDGRRVLGIVVEVGQAVPDGTELRNVVQVSSDVPGLNDGLIDEAVTVVQASADLEVFKTVRPDVLVAGAEASFGIRVLNRGPSAATDLVLTDVVPAGLVVESAIAGGGECAVSGQTVTCTRHSLAADASWRVVVQVTVDPATRGAVANTATVAAGMTDPDEANDTATVVAPVEANADVGMIKTALRPDVHPGETAPFFLTAVNLGPSTADAVTVVDELPVGLIPSAVSDDACTIRPSPVPSATSRRGPRALPSSSPRSRATPPKASWSTRRRQRRPRQTVTRPTTPTMRLSSSARRSRSRPSPTCRWQRSPTPTRRHRERS
jgi:uncharacterized repeat protein (TIGR01451 family)